MIIICHSSFKINQFILQFINYLLIKKFGLYANNILKLF